MGGSGVAPTRHEHNGDYSAKAIRRLVLRFEDQRR